MKKFCPLRLSLLITLAMFSYVNLCQAEDFTTAISNCGKIMFNGQRLKCYDKIRDGMVEQKQPTAEQKQPSINPKPNSAYQPMSITDFLMDYDSLKKGEKLALTGALVLYDKKGGYLAKGINSSARILVYISDNDNMPRENLKLAMQHCLDGCKARLLGEANGPDFWAHQITVLAK